MDIILELSIANTDNARWPRISILRNNIRNDGKLIRYISAVKLDTFIDMRTHGHSALQGSRRRMREQKPATFVW